MGRIEEGGQDRTDAKMPKIVRSLTLYHEKTKNCEKKMKTALIAGLNLVRQPVAHLAVADFSLGHAVLRLFNDRTVDRILVDLMQAIDFKRPFMERPVVFRPQAGGRVFFVGNRTHIY